MILRFQQGNDLIAKAIIAQEKTAMPFTPSHVEALTPDGGFYIGAHLDGGVMKRPVGYDKDTTVNELLLPLPATAEQDNAFYAFLESHLGEPYDWTAILGFIIPDHLHMIDHAICSALITLAMRAPKCEWFKYRLSAPAHLIDPRDLLLMISSQMQIPGV